MIVNQIHCGVELILDEARSVEVVSRDLLDDFEPMKTCVLPRSNVVAGDKFDSGFRSRHHAWASTVVGGFVITKRWVL